MRRNFATFLAILAAPHATHSSSAEIARALHSGDGSAKFRDKRGIDGAKADRGCYAADDVLAVHWRVDFADVDDCGECVSGFSSG
jgi:hypothetical protein